LLVVVTIVFDVIDSDDDDIGVDDANPADGEEIVSASTR